jgi:hydroxymethylglutaryl-CoA lyase
VLGCPFEGEIEPEKVRDVALMLLDLGCHEISLGDTVGRGTAGATAELLDCLIKKIPVEKLAVHFHDTYGQALANILISLQVSHSHTLTLSVSLFLSVFPPCLSLSLSLCLSL